MPRRPLSKEQKASMQSARKATALERQAALEVLQSNSQFMKPKFWVRVPPELQEAVAKAMRKAGRAAKKAEIARLQRKIMRLQAEQ